MGRSCMREGDVRAGDRPSAHRLSMTLPIRDDNNAWLADWRWTYQLRSDIECDRENGQTDEREEGKDGQGGELLLGDEKGKLGKDGLGHPDRRRRGGERKETGPKA